MQVFSSDRSRKHAAALLVVAALVVAGFYALTRQYAGFIFETAALQQWLQQFGAWAPVAFILVQALQTVVAPIPGHVTAVVGGYLFGTLWGSLYSSIGVLLGTAIGFLLARRYGRPAVERMLSQEALDRFDGFIDDVGLPGLFLFVVVPGLPDDVLAVLGGLTTYKMRTFLTVMVLGRFPAFLLFSYAGHSVVQGRLIDASIVLGSIVILATAVYHWQDDLQAYLSKL